MEVAAWRACTLMVRFCMYVILWTSARVVRPESYLQQNLKMKTTNVGKQASHSTFARVEDGKCLFAKQNQ